MLVVSKADHSIKRKRSGEHRCFLLLFFFFPPIKFNVYIYATYWVMADLTFFFIYLHILA